MKLRSLLATSGASVAIAVVLAMGAVGLSTNTAKAGFIVPDSNFALLNLSPAGPNPVIVNYDATTEAFTSHGPFGSDTQPASLAIISASPGFAASDIIGIFSLSATVDNTGALVGVGTFTLFGQSTTLGILTPTTLLSGLVQDDGTNSGGIFQTSGAVTSLNPDLEAVVGPINSAVLDFIGIESFAMSFSRFTASESPDIFLVGVPEPPSAPLFAVGALVVLALRLRWRRRRSSHRREPGALTLTRPLQLWRSLVTVALSVK